MLNIVDLIYHGSEQRRVTAPWLEPTQIQIMHTWTGQMVVTESNSFVCSCQRHNYPHNRYVIKPETNTVVSHPAEDYFVHIYKIPSTPTGLLKYLSIANLSPSTVAIVTTNEDCGIYSQAATSNFNLFDIEDFPYALPYADIKLELYSKTDIPPPAIQMVIEHANIETRDTKTFQLRKYNYENELMCSGGTCAIKYIQSIPRHTVAPDTIHIHTTDTLETVRAKVEQIMSNSNLSVTKKIAQLQSAW